VTGEGSCTVENYGGCWPVLLMTYEASDSFTSWTPSSSDVVFETTDAGYPTTQLTGRVTNGPSQIALGHWSVGIGLARGSDVPDQPDYGTVICHQEFDVTPTATSVRISASLSGYDVCDLRVDVVDPSAQISSTPPSGLEVGALATVLVDGVRQLADPNKPRSHAYESPGVMGSRSLSRLKQGTHVYVVDGPLVVGDATYWKVAPEESFFGCCAPFGWISATSNAEATIGPFSPICPETSQPLSATDMLSLEPLTRLECFGNGDLKATGLVSCSKPIADSPAFIDSPWEHAPDRPLYCTLEDQFIPMVGDVLRSFVGSSDTGSQASIITGHFDDPGSSECRWVPGDYGNIVPNEGGPTETARFDCRLQFVVTDLVAQ